MDKEQLIAQRREMLAFLYEKRQEEGYRPLFAPEHEIKNRFGECNFNLTCLRELGYIEGKGGNQRITAQGVLYYEELSL